MAPKTLYLNTELQHKRYIVMKKTLFTNKELIKDMRSLNICHDDINLYLSYKFFEHTDIIDYYYENMLKENTEVSKHQNSNKILEHMYKNLLTPLHTISNYQNLHNNFFKKFSNSSINYDNPFFLNNKMISSEFDITKNSAIEIYSKNMLWASRLAKETEIIRKNIIQNSCPKGSKEFQMINCGKTYHSIYKNVLKDTSSKESLLENFLRDFSSYIYGDFQSEDELKQCDSYKKVEAILKNSNSNKDYKITPTQFYKYASCEISQERLYELKHYCIDLIVQKYAEINKKGNNNVKIYSTIDKKRESKSYDSNFNVSLPGYNTDFKVHVDSKYLNDLTLKYDAQINYENPETPFIPYMVYKPTPIQKKQINQLSKTNNNISIQKIIEYENDRIQKFENKGEKHVR